MGTRFREETEYRPKPLVEIGGRPILWHIMKIYRTHGFRKFVLCLGYKGWMIKEYFLNFEWVENDFTVRLGPEHEVQIKAQSDQLDWEITLVGTGLHTNTGGRIRLVERYIQTDTFMVTYGDGVADIDLKALLAFHLAHGRLATVTGFHPVSRFGVIEAEDDHRVRAFQEKPRLDGLISGGFFVFNRRVFDYLLEDCVLEQEPLARLAKEGELMVYRHGGFWKSLDTYRDFLDFNRIWEEGNIPWKVW